MIVALFRRRLKDGVTFAFYDLRTERDFSGYPRAIDLASAESLLAAMQRA